MKFCQAHWDLLRTKIDEADLSAFIADGGEAVAKRMVEGGFEPLLGAHNAIVSNALDQFGLALMMPDEQGKDRCPVCVILACPCGKDDCGYKTWIDRAVGDQVTEAKRRGLLASA